MAESIAAKRKILIISTDKNLRDVLRFCFEGWGFEVIQYQSAPSGITPIKRTAPDVIVVDVQAAKRTDLEICRLLKDDFITAFIPVIALINKRQLRSQLLSIKQGVDDYLIKPPDPLDLRVRVEMVMKRAQYSFYASPLTGLPGGRIVEEALRDRIVLHRSFSFGYLDIDNFKYFNDTYGYIKGDRAIMQTAYLLYTTISRYGNHDDFIGHIGGDDFAFITTPDRHKDICDNFIKEFNRIMQFHYSQNDRSHGYVIARDRTHKVKKIPLMSVSIAIVSCEKGSEFRNIIEINEKIAEIKRYLKGLEGSKYMEDRRSDPSGNGPISSKEPHIYRRLTESTGSMEPLGQRLMKRGSITAEQLDEALAVHWRRGIRLGDILIELGHIARSDISSALTGE